MLATHFQFALDGNVLYHFLELVKTIRPYPWHPLVQYRVDGCPPLVSTLNQINPVYAAFLTLC
jgi:hypothetical protein